jgi:hypothetical protein
MTFQIFMIFCVIRILDKNERTFRVEFSFVHAINRSLTMKFGWSSDKGWLMLQ